MMLEWQRKKNARHLGLPGEAGTMSPPGRRIRDRKVFIGAALLSTVTLGAAGVALYREHAEPVATPAPVGAAPAAAPLPKLPPPDLFKPLSPEEAKAANAERPLAANPGAPPAPFAWRGTDPSKLRAVDCLTQAVYYEAASEGVDGGRAVAQVVLNRVRHPGYPNTVCGTVYQGSDRSTGCQFTFTCDGSLARTPLAYLWARSRKIAQEALAGRTFAAVGLSTHYHADYVLPYWADSLDKAAVIGRHIFYRFKGANGTRAAFSQRYAASEPAPPLPPTSTEVIEQGIDAVAIPVPGAATEALALPKVEEDRIESLAASPKAPAQDNQPLSADLDRGQLMLGDPPQPSAKRNRDTNSACDAGGGPRLKAVGANDLRSTAEKAGC